MTSIFTRSSNRGSKVRKARHRLSSELPLRAGGEALRSTNQCSRVGVTCLSFDCVLVLRLAKGCKWTENTRSRKLSRPLTERRLPLVSMHALQQSVKARHFIILVQNDYIPPFPPFITNSKEPVLHDQVAIQPEISSRLKFPVCSPFSVQFVVSGIALS